MPNPSESGNFFNQYRFFILLVLALLLGQVPFISIPLNWLEAYFHELSHGLAAVISGGKIMQIQLFANGAGLCTTRGGNALLISFMGYTGAIGWGVIMYLVAGSHTRFAQGFIFIICTLLTLTLIFWARDLLTFFICLILVGIFALSYKLHQYNKLTMVMQFIAMIILLNGLQSPFYLIDGKPFGDGAALAKITFIPEIIWVLIWSAIGIAALFFVGKKR